MSYERFSVALNGLPIDVRPHESIWIELFLELDEPNSINWSTTLREESVAHIKEWTNEIEVTKSENAHGIEYSDGDQSMSGDISYDVEDDSYSQHDSANAYSEQEENCENISCSNIHEPIEVSDLNNIDHLVVNFNPQNICNQGYETMLQHIATLYDQHDKGYDADISYCIDKINVHKDMSTTDLMPASDWENVYRTKGKPKEN